jgi:hypothetical protein
MLPVADHNAYDVAEIVTLRRVLKIKPILRNTEKGMRIGQGIFGEETGRLTLVNRRRF